MQLNFTDKVGTRILKFLKIRGIFLFSVYTAKGYRINYVFKDSFSKYHFRLKLQYFISDYIF